MNEQKGYADQFSDVFNRYKNVYIRYVNSYIRNIHDAEDIVMDAYMAFWEKRAEMDNIRNIYAYILSIVKNRTLNYLEHRKVVAEALEKIQEHSERELNFRIDTLRACEPEELFSEEVRSIVERGLNRVSDLDARIFKMSKLDDKTNKEIAAALDISLKTVEAHITKITKIMRRHLRDYL